MGSLIDELKRREAAAGEEAEELRGRIAQLIERLAQADGRPSRLVIARETVDEVPNGPAQRRGDAAGGGAVAVRASVSGRAAGGAAVAGGP